MKMALDSQAKRNILDLFPQAQAVFTREVRGQETIVVLTDDSFQEEQQTLPGILYDLPVSVRRKPKLTDLRLRLPLPTEPERCRRRALHQSCHNEPVPGGVQLQPQGAGWVGTLGTACFFESRSGGERCGILSNWHVMVTCGDCYGHPQHQPTDQYPAIAHLDDFEEVRPNQTNYIDAAVADARINGLHSVGPNLLEAGHVGDTPCDAVEGAQVAKSGRTTGYQKGVCVGTGAAVSIGYGDFTATFEDQDVFEGSSGNFSGPGDSGSLIFGANDRCPTALLFAGGGDITIGCPIRHIVERFQVNFRFP